MMSISLAVLDKERFVSAILSVFIESEHVKKFPIKFIIHFDRRLAPLVALLGTAG